MTDELFNEILSHNPMKNLHNVIFDHCQAITSATIWKVCCQWWIHYPHIIKSVSKMQSIPRNLVSTPPLLARFYFNIKIWYTFLKSSKASILKPNLFVTVSAPGNAKRTFCSTLLALWRSSEQNKGRNQEPHQRWKFDGDKRQQQQKKTCWLMLWIANNIVW